ncbi:hypothetical protein JDV02_002932 [Purpureocillium takamizusanense]|uniref:Uncharacterized protein n=1 Tax=Purpureocillium takamizusanense TaxID=2060973 RepID=A0A9Q8QCN3_9HYPO|nr:uncharacterized protein JDV02_002932 [Purpureocillium takamizusanense]UNI16501.1 hypothetical protein JDV02_002932 [Purpureocillium takamizusanense]
MRQITRRSEISTHSNRRRQVFYCLALIGYAVTVRVLAAPGDLDSRSLGYIDRAQDIEAYCIVTCTLLFFAWLGPLAVVLFPMSVAAVALCVVEAVRLSKVSERHACSNTGTLPSPSSSSPSFSSVILASRQPGLTVVDCASAKRVHHARSARHHDESPCGAERKRGLGVVRVAYEKEVMGTQAAK